LAGLKVWNYYKPLVQIIKEIIWMQNFAKPDGKFQRKSHCEMSLAHHLKAKA